MIGPKQKRRWGDKGRRKERPLPQLDYCKRPKPLWLAAVLAIAVEVLAKGAWAQTQAPPAASSPQPQPIDVVVRGQQTKPAPVQGRAATKVTQQEIQERAARSAPDALRYEPGVYVQQTSHGQGSAFIRGRTGQQTVLIFDGIRLNTSTYRQGPNQYFFTVDSRTLRGIDVLRGGASTRYGSDAIGGALIAQPIEPALDLEATGMVVRPKAMLRGASADHEFGERYQLDTQLSKQLRVLTGIGFRRVGLLQSGGIVRSPENGQAPQVPAFESDGRTQLGTGFRELTGDGRIVYSLANGERLVAALYAYRQYDAPRTDQCPPPYAPRSECLRYDEQFRTLGYVAWDGRLQSLDSRARVALSFQRQHERRTHNRPSARVQNGGIDDVNTLGLTVSAETQDKPLGGGIKGKLGYGADAYWDEVSSRAWSRFTDIDLLIRSSRGLYLQGSRYVQGGAYVEPALTVFPWLLLRAGGRLGAALAKAPSDPESGTASVDRLWQIAVGHLGVEVKPRPWVSVLMNVDRSYRTPNLDDLTSRQQTGPGFQFENAKLQPETSLSWEAGLRLGNDDVQAEAWAYRSTVHSAITRVLKDQRDCPPATPQCGASWTRYQLINLAGASEIRGLELALRSRLWAQLWASATLAMTHGEGPNPQARPTEPTIAYQERVPLSRIPPTNGTAEVRWVDGSGVRLGAGLRWALEQRQLAPTDRSDARIPQGGTPGFWVLDLRGGYQWSRACSASLVVENVGDVAYRYHGSSINGPGRGVIATFEVGL